MKEVERLRKLGAKRVTLKTGAYPMRELAMAIKWASEAKIDLLTIDGAPGGTGMSPWRMMEEWGMPDVLSAVHDAGPLPETGRPEAVCPGHRHCRRLQHRGPRLQGSGDGRSVHARRSAWAGL